ncbi:MAG: IPT/TIG domain-containing protein [Bacteroidales bacterium]|nr:IPT/TIG domain-containing protein [Bacteroidales bacterium]
MERYYRFLSILTGLFMALLVLSTCNEKDESVPVVQTGEITMLDDSLMVVTAVILNDPGNIIEYGFVWGIDPDNVASKKISCGSVPQSDVYESRIDKENILAALVEYRVRAFVRTETKTFYGREVKFLSIAGSGPRIDYFEPEAGTWGDTVSIYGHNFLERPGSAKVSIGNINLKLEKVNDSLAVVVIPANLNQVQAAFTLTNSNRATTSANKYVILPPVLKGISPDSATVGTRLEIKGKRFSLMESFVDVKVDGKVPTFQIDSDSLISMVMPSGIISTNPEIKVAVLGQEAGELLYTINANPIVRTVTPSVWSGDQITITGKFFGPATPVYTKVYVNGLQCTLNQVSDTLIKAVVPLSVEPGPATVKVTTENRLTEVSGQLAINGPIATGIEPPQAAFGDDVVITGTGFTQYGDLSVSFDEFEATITEITDNLIRVVIPNTINKENTTIRLKTDDRTFYTTTLFKLSLPVIQDVNPKQFTFLDTILISGVNYNPDPARNSIRIGTVNCPIIEANESQIVALVPKTYTSVTGGSDLVRVITNSTLISDGPVINLNMPVINDVNPKQFTFLDTITINGVNFNPDPTTSKIYIDSKLCTVIDGDREQIRAIVPVTYYNTTGGAEVVRLLINSSLISYGPAIDFITPEVIAVNPASATIGDTIMITGNFFNPVPANNIVMLGTQVLPVISASSNIISATAAQPLSGEFLLTVKAGNKTSTQSVLVTIFNPYSTIDLKKNGQFVSTRWSMIAFITGDKLIVGQGEQYSYTFSDYFRVDPGIPLQLSEFLISDNNLTHGAFSFSYSNIGYVLSNRKLFRYDDDIPGFLMVSQFPGNAVRYQSGFLTGDKLYVGTGRNGTGQTLDEFWEYDLVSGVWTQRASYPGGPMSGGTAFAINGKGYMGFGISSQRNLYEYEPSTDTWSLKCYIPDMVTGIETGIHGLVSIPSGGKAIIGLGQKTGTSTIYGNMYSYDPVDNKWERLTGLNYGLGISYPVLVSDGESGYLVGGYGLHRLQVIKFKISDL